MVWLLQVCMYLIKCRVSSFFFFVSRVSTTLSGSGWSLLCTTLGLWYVQNWLCCRGVSMHLVFTEPGRPMYSTNPASSAVHTCRLFFWLPSKTSTSPHPFLLHRWPVTLCTVDSCFYHLNKNDGTELNWPSIVRVPPRAQGLLQIDLTGQLCLTLLQHTYMCVLTSK